MNNPATHRQDNTRQNEVKQNKNHKNTARKTKNMRYTDPTKNKEQAQYGLKSMFTLNYSITQVPARQRVPSIKATAIDINVVLISTVTRMK